MGKILGVTLNLNPKSPVLGYTDRNVGSCSRRLYTILRYAAQRNIFLSWSSERPPITTNWHRLVLKLFPMGVADL